MYVLTSKKKKKEKKCTGDVPHAIDFCLVFLDFLFLFLNPKIRDRVDVSLRERASNKEDRVYVKDKKIYEERGWR